MNPKTFQIRLQQPFGIVSQEAYIFYLHAESTAEAFAWVERVFDGIDIRQTPPASRPRIGSVDVVNVTDCDAYRKRARVHGRFQVVNTPPGYFRQPETEVAARLGTVYKNLQLERVRLAQSFASLKANYERDGTEWVYDRLVLIQEMHAKAVRWEANVRQECAKITPQDKLVLPEKRLPPVLKHIVTSARERVASAD